VHRISHQHNNFLSGRPFLSFNSALSLAISRSDNGSQD
jgi:hypothetical protein